MKTTAIRVWFTVPDEVTPEQVQQLVIHELERFAKKGLPFAVTEQGDEVLIYGWNPFDTTLPT